MYVSKYMSTPVVSIDPSVLIPEALDILRDKKFRHLPVIDREEKLIGIVSDRDLRSAYPSSILPEAERRPVIARIEKTRVERIMTINPVTLSTISTLDDALFIFSKRNVGALPVLDRSRRVMGIFSDRDMLKAYKHLFGLGSNDSALIEIEDDGQPNILTKIVEVLEKSEISFSRILKTQPEGIKSEKNNIYVRIHTLNLRLVHSILLSSGLKPIKTAS